MSKLASKVGVPLYIDRVTKSKDLISFARVLVEVEIIKPLPRKITTLLPNGREVEMELNFEIVLKHYVGCQKLGHHQNVYKVEATTSIRHTKDPNLALQKAQHVTNNKLEQTVKEIVLASYDEG